MSATLAMGRPAARRLALAYLELTKPRIVLLVLMTGVPALLMARAGFPGPRVFWGALLGIALAAGSAACFNNYIDRNLDRLMTRTARRALPSGIVPPSHALALGVALGALSGLVLVAWTRALAAILGLASIFFYAVIYTAWLKRRTPQNIVIGGGAGASAPLIAWAAVTGHLGLPAALMSAIVFLWTPPHFWALALFSREDYAHARIPMLPVTHGEGETRRQILYYSLALVVATIALGPAGTAGPFYWIPAAAMGAGFVYYAQRLRRSASRPHAIRLFRYSIIYLLLLFGFLTLDAIVRIVGRGSSV